MTDLERLKERVATLDVERVVGDALAAITQTYDNQARAVSKGSAPYGEAFFRAALASNVADAIRAALAHQEPRETPQGWTCEEIDRAISAARNAHGAPLPHGALWVDALRRALEEPAPVSPFSHTEDEKP